MRRTSLIALILGVLASCSADPAFARRHHVAHRGRVAVTHRHARPLHLGGAASPALAIYAVDGNSGRVLVDRDGDELRHPASITKVMTLYLLFEQLERGHLTLDSRLAVSEHAAAQAPTKLGLRPGSTIRVEDAIKAIVTKSANDMAVAVAEKIGGDEDNFARLMTRKAHALGMSRSNFVNASGLPDDMQLTTAHDLAILGRAVHDRFPRYFRFFSTPSFRYAGQFMENHNHLMEHVEGMDGIKTGYTRSSGFNLLSSVNRNGHWLISVVLGGRTRLARDRMMEDLIEAQVDHCATLRTAPRVAENPALERVAEAIPVVQHTGDAAPEVQPVDDESAETKGPAVTEVPPTDAVPAATEVADAVPPVPPSRPEPTRDEPTRDEQTGEESPKTVTAPLKVASLASDIAMPRPRPAFVSGVPRPPERDLLSTGSIRPRDRHDGATPRYAGATTTTPSSLRHGAAHRDRADPAEKARPIKLASLDSDLPTARPTAHGGWTIQIGATPTIDAANVLIGKAKGQSHGALAAAKPYTEKVAKGGGTLYRARFAGLESETAERACKALKKAGIACFATRN